MRAEFREGLPEIARQIQGGGPWNGAPNSGRGCAIRCAREREREGGGEKEDGGERKVETVQKPTFSTTAWKTVVENGGFSKNDHFPPQWGKLWLKTSVFRKTTIFHHSEENCG